MKPTISDILILLGLVLLGTGLFFSLGLGVALTVDGALVVAMGIAGNIAEAKNGNISATRRIEGKGHKPRRSV